MPIERLVRPVVRFCCGGARVLTQVSGLSEFVLEKDDVLWQRLSGPQSDPGLRDGTRGDEPPSPETTVLLIVEQMLVAHEMVLDLLDLGAVETGAAVPSGLIGEIVRDVRDVAVVGSEVLVGGLGPLHVMRRIAGPIAPPVCTSSRSASWVGASKWSANCSGRSFRDEVGCCVASARDGVAGR